MDLDREMFWIGDGGGLNSFQLSAIRKNGSQQSAVRSRKRRESEFPPTEESGLQTPPTKNITAIKNRGYKPLPQEIHPLQRIGVTNPSYKRYTHSVFSNPPNLPCQRVEDFKRKCVSPHSHFLNQVVLLGFDMRIHRAFEYA